MKKVMKKILNSLTLVAMVLVMALSVIAFTTINGNAAENGSNINNPGNINDPTNPEEPDISNDPEELSSLSGIYQFKTYLGFDDIYFDDLDALIAYFETKDLNGVYNAVKPLGFDAFIKNFVSLNDNFRALYFNKGTATMMVNNNGIFNFVDTEGEDCFEYTVTDGKIETNVPVLKLEYDETTNIPTLYTNFNYNNADGENVVTPLFVKASLEYVADSDSAFEGNGYSYVKSSASIVTTSEMGVEINSKLLTLANMLGIEITEESNISELIENGFNSCSLLINQDASRIVVDFKDGSYKISSINQETKTFAWNNAQAKIVSRTLNLETNTYTVQFEIEIDEETKLTFSYIANA